MKCAAWGAGLGFLLLSSCGRDERWAPTPDPPALSEIAELPLDELDSAQAETLCKAALAHVDPCRTIGMHSVGVAECEAAVATCHSSVADAQQTLDCSGLSLGPPGSCPIQVSDYLECLDAWNDTQVCSNTGHLIETPAACLPLVTNCVRFGLSFYQDGEPPSCDPPSSSPPPDTNDDIYGLDGCRPKPARLVVLGDSIAACLGVGPAECTPNQLVAHLKETVAPGIVLESQAKSGAFTAELPVQAQAVAGGPGHVLVWVYAIGNDLATDKIDYPGWNKAWSEVFAYFTDPSRFPDGATFLLNTQYSPYDQCPDPPGPSRGVTDEQEQLLQDVNKALFIDVAMQRPDSVAVDHYPDFLGHGRNADLKGCPHCGADNTHWLQGDGTHPGPAGFAHMTEKWKMAFAKMYGAGC